MAAKQSTNNKTLWIIIGVIVIAVVSFSGYKVWHHHKVAMMQTNSTNTSRINGNPTSNTQNTTNTNGLANNNTSNQQLDQDVQNIQNSLNQLQQDQSTSNADVSNQSQDTPQQ